VKTLIVSEYIQAAVLKGAGIRFLGAEPGERVGLIFDDSDGRASEISSEHVNGGVGVNSASFEAALGFVKNQIFATKRNGGGVDRRRDLARVGGR
jgi:hypothetical protein